MNNEKSSPQDQEPQESASEKTIDLSDLYENIRKAVEYIKNKNTWPSTDPVEKSIQQPDNQAELLVSLERMLSTMRHGAELRNYLLKNLDDIKSVQPLDDYGHNKLAIRPKDRITRTDEDIDDPDREAEIKSLEFNSKFNEKISDPEQANVMISGLLEATGAEMLRENIDETDTITRTYKGVHDGRVVYFDEVIAPLSLDRSEEDEDGNSYERSFLAISEEAARASLEMLSDKDATVLRSIGIDIPEQYSDGKRPTRSQMQEIVEDHARMVMNMGESKNK